MTNQLKKFKDAALSTDLQENTQGGLSKSKAFKLMLGRIKKQQAKAKFSRNKTKQNLHLRERCKLELRMFKTW